jgi:uncharacterized phage protein (TIGR02220 family)
MAENKKSFVLYADLLHTIDHLTNEEKGLLFTHLLEYVNDLDPTLEDRLILTAWKPIERQLKRDLIKFNEVKVKRSDAGKRSAELRALKKGKQSSTNSTSVKSVQHRSTNPTDNVNDNVNVNVIKENIYIDFDLLMKFYNETFGRAIKVIPAKAKKQIADRMKEGYTKEDLKQVLLNAKSDSYHIETKYKYITLEFVTRSDKFERFSQNHLLALPKPKKV